MGWGSWLAGAGAVVGGIVAAPFTGGLSIPAGISAGASLIGAGMASDASKNAAKTQVAATDKAIGLQQPYMNAGTNAVNRLDSLMGGSGALSAMGSGQGSPQPMSSMAMPANPAAPPTPWGQTGHNSGRMISMRAPDGSVKAVPASEAAHWQQKGATVIG